jgi:hypothetical protein
LTKLNITYYNKSDINNGKSVIVKLEVLKMTDLIEIKEQLNGDLPLYISNKIIESHFSLPLGEQRLLYAYISKLSDEHIEFPELTLSVKELADMLNLADPNYKIIKHHVDNLMDRKLAIENDEELIIFHWFSIARYRKKEGILKLKIHDELKPYLLRLKKEFTRLISRQVMQFKSVYSIRIYMLCKQYQSIGKRLVEVDELRKKLGIEVGQYKLYGHFKSRVLEQAQKEINNLSDIEIQFEEIKQARKVTEILFLINKNVKNELKEDGGAHAMFLKSTGELAGMLQKEILKRWKVDLQDVIFKYPDKEVYVALLWEILRGSYDEKKILHPRNYFDGALRNLQEDIKKDHELQSMEKLPIED